MAAFHPTHDAHVRDGSYASTNYGAEPELQTKNDLVGYTRHAYLTFDAASFGPGPAADAKLRVFASVAATAGSTDAYPLDLHGVADTAWTEAALTWANKPPMAAAALAGVTVQGTTGR